MSRGFMPVFPTLLDIDTGGEPSAGTPPEQMYHHMGLGVRELYAAMKMQALSGSPEDVAKAAVEYADALIAELYATKAPQAPE